MDTMTFLRVIARRRTWLARYLTPRKVFNVGLAVIDFLLKREKVVALPVIVKIDISPLCNLHCPACVHAEPNGNVVLEQQRFESSQRLSVAQFQRIVTEIKATATSVSLFYLGDPLLHPELEVLIQIATEAGLSVHVTTNFSFSLTDERIRKLVESGLSNLTVCVDGLSQEKYQRTRVGGNISRVLSNLERVCTQRKLLDRKLPFVEVQYIMYQHNLDEMEETRRLSERIGVNKFSSFWGYLHNCTDGDPGTYEVLRPRPRQIIPRCYWPYFSTVIKYNGDVIPCCNFRFGSQYASNADSRAIGNIFETNLAGVWNSTAYKLIRSLVSKPIRAESDDVFRNQFCDSCPALFETTRDNVRRPGNEFTFEDVYRLNERGRPVPLRFNSQERKVSPVQNEKKCP